jgi:EAL domain-containing protein (putative c-di-GMP-specific phosphodiesterase class I)
MLYQPEVRLDDGALVALEALVRLPGYRHSTEHMIRAAEESRLIVPLGERVLDLAVADAAAWNQAGRNVRLAVNISPEQVRSGSIGASVERVLDHYGLPAPQLELELTEHVVLEQSDDAIRTIGKLRELGVTIAIDDFGTGYSSLAYLRRFPVDKLKIDRTFVSGLTENTRDRALVDAMISVALKLGLSIVAEGIEAPEQAAILRSMGCQLGQGYWFGRPVAASAVNWDTGAGGMLIG